MKVLKTSLEAAPELTLDDLREMKIPIDLLELIPLSFCRKAKMLPLRYEPTSRILSFVFVDSEAAILLEDLRKKHNWAQLSAYRISENEFEALANQVEKVLDEQKGNSPQTDYSIALIEPDVSIRQSLQNILKAQGYTVVPFENEEKFKSHLQKLLADLKQNEDELISIAEKQKLIPFQSILVREAALSTPRTFSDFVWAHLSHLKIAILEDRWLHRILESSASSSMKNQTDLEFYLRHQDFYHAAMECLKQGNLFQAVELLEQVPSDNIYFVKARLALGKAFLKKKNYNKAVVHFQKAYDHWCEDPDGVVDETTINLLYHLAFAFEKINRIDDAMKLYERVVGENPQFKDVSERLSSVRKLQRKAQADREKKEGLPAFSRDARDRSRYDKIEEIGRGGMGIVYRARDQVLGREVALKILNSHFKHDEKIVETFLREAKSLAALNHVNIVTIFDAGIESGNYYIAMEFIEGRTIRDLLKKKGYFKLPTALALSKQVLRALSYAHSKHVIHRDITTNNMMLTEGKILKLMDFGLARVVNQLHSEQSIIGGTPYFMSPEQVEGAPIDHRTDIYSFGVCLFEMLTGQVPFPMENPGYHHLHTLPPDPRTIRSEIPARIAESILRCLKKKPDERFQSADEIIEIIRSIPINDEVSVSSRPSRRKSS